MTISSNPELAYNRKTDYSFANDYVLALRDYALTKGVTTRALIADTGVSLEDLLPPPKRVKRETAHALFHNICKILPPPHITALEYGRYIALGTHGVMGVAAQSCNNVREACNILCQYIKTRSEISIAEPHETEAGLTIRILMEEDFAPIADPEMEKFFELLTTRNLDYFLTLVVGEQYPEEQVLYKLKQTKPDKNFDCQDYYHTGKLVFDNDQFEIEIPMSWLDIKLSSSDHELKTIAEEKCKSELKMLSPNDLLQEIRDRLRANNGMNLTIESAAQQLFMSTSTLQRKLKQENITFQNIKLQERQSLAKELLVNSKASIEDIAEQLGFSDGSNFAKSFKKWTGHTPAKYRETQV